MHEWNDFTNIFPRSIIALYGIRPNKSATLDDQHAAVRPVQGTKHDYTTMV